MDIPEGASSQTMAVRDDIFYTTFEAPIESYSRIKFFQSKLKDIFSRLQRIYDPIPESLKLPKIKSRSLSDAVGQLTISSPRLFLFDTTHSEISKADLCKEFRHLKFESHLLDEIPSFDDEEKKYKLFGAICTLRMIETPKGMKTLLKLKDCFGVENMLFFVNDSNKDLVVNNLELLRDFLKHKINVVYQSENNLSTAISNHMEHKFINAFRLLNQYLIEASRKTRYSCGCIFGPKDATTQLTIAIMEFFRNPLTIFDLLLTIEPASTETLIDIKKAIENAIVRLSKTVLVRETVSTFQLKGNSVTDYLEEHNYDEKCMLLLEKNNVVEKALPNSQLITQLQKMTENHKKLNSVEQRLAVNRLVERLYDYGKRKERSEETSLRKQLEAFSKTVAEETSDVLLSYFLDICSNIKGIRTKLNLLAHLRQELLNIMDKTIDEKKYAEVIPDLKKWTNLLARIKEVKAVLRISEKLCVLVKEPEAGERANEVRLKIRKCLLDYPGEVFIEVSSDSLYAGVDGIDSSRQITMGDAFLNGNGLCGTIGLFMNKNGNECEDLHFVTCNHIVLESEYVTTADQNPIPLGRRAHAVCNVNGLVDISAIQIHSHMRGRCNPFFNDDTKTRKCHILDMDNIEKLQFEHVYKKSSSTGLTMGCILDFQSIGLGKHNIVVGMPVGCDGGSFAQPGDSGAVVYTETVDGEIQYISLIMGELHVCEPCNNSIFAELKQSFGPLIITSCLWEGLNQIEEILNCKLTLPMPKEILS